MFSNRCAVFGLALWGVACGSDDPVGSDAGPSDAATGPADTGPCVVSEAHAYLGCVGEDVVWLDNCGAPNDALKSCSGTGGCSAGQCIERGWFGLGSSEFGPRSERVVWGSASGYGVGGRRSYGPSEPSIAVDPVTGFPIVAFDDANGVSTRARVFAWDGEMFEEIGDSPSGGFGPAGVAARAPSLKVAKDGRPMLAWIGSEAAGQYNVFFRQFDGSSWVELAGSGSSNGLSGGTEAGAPALVLDAEDRPHVVWSTDGELRLKRWDASQWVGVGGSDVGGAWAGANDRTSRPSIALDSSSNPYVAFCETSTGAKMRVWTGSDWASFGSGPLIATGPSEGECQDTAIQVDDSGFPTVAWIGQGDVMVRRFNGSGWEELAGSATGEGVSQSGGTAYELDLALMTNGDPVVSWRGAGDGGMVNEFSVYLRRWNGTSWVELSGSASGDGISRDPRATVGAVMAIGADDRPYVAWEVLAQYPSRTSLIHLRWFDGSDWVELGDRPQDGGGISNTTRGARGQQVELNDRLEPTVVWWDQSDPEGYPQILLRRWNGAVWEELSGSGTGRGISQAMHPCYYPDLALDPQNNPIVAWTQGFDPEQNEETFLRRWTGTTWEELGGSATGGGISKTDERSAVVRVALDGNGSPVVSWLEDNASGNSTYLRRYDGQSWVELDGSASGGGINGEGEYGYGVLGISQVSGEPIIAWSSRKDGRLNVRRWNGSEWESFAAGGFQAEEDEIFGFDMDIGESDEIAAVWSARVAEDNYEVRVRLWDGIAWRDLDGSASGEGISKNSGRSVDPAVKLDHLGRPIVAWNDNTTGNDEILLSRWDGAHWEGVLGSDVDGGVSNSENDSEGPALDYRDTRLCVAWGELGARAQQTVLRCVDFAPE